MALSSRSTPAAPEDESRDRADGGERDRDLVAGDRGEAGAVQSEPRLDARRERLRVDVRDPEDDDRDGHDHRQVPGMGIRRRRRHCGHDHDRPVHGLGDAAGAAQEDALGS
jgi:hypothetical protein